MGVVLKTSCWLSKAEATAFDPTPGSVEERVRGFMTWGLGVWEVGLEPTPPSPAKCQKSCFTIPVLVFKKAGGDKTATLWAQLRSCPCGKFK